MFLKRVMQKLCGEGENIQKLKGNTAAPYKLITSSAQNSPRFPDSPLMPMGSMSSRRGSAPPVLQQVILPESPSTQEVELLPEVRQQVTPLESLPPQRVEVKEVRLIDMEMISLAVEAVTAMVCSDRFLPVELHNPARLKLTTIDELNKLDTLKSIQFVLFKYLPDAKKERDILTEIISCIEERHILTNREGLVGVAKTLTDKGQELKKRYQEQEEIVLLQGEARKASVSNSSADENNKEVAEINLVDSPCASPLSR